MLSMKTNMMAENAVRHLNVNFNNLSRNIERLSSGLRINSSRDDAAGMAVVSMLRADIAVLEQGRRNARDGVSMLQTAEGAMGVIGESLLRMKSLAEQASTGTYSKAQRGIMHAEFEQMAREITRISSSTEFNGVKMLNNTRELSIHLGNGSSIDMDLADSRASAMGLDQLSINGDDVESAQHALEALNNAIEDNSFQRSMFGVKMNRLEKTEDVLAIQKENLLAAKQRIEDVDVAHEAAELAKNQVLTQASTAMLAQANDLQKKIIETLLS